MKLISINDTWLLFSIPLSQGEFLINTGDLTRYGKLLNLQDFYDLLGTLPRPYRLDFTRYNKNTFNKIGFSGY